MRDYKFLIDSPEYKPSEGRSFSSASLHEGLANANEEPVSYAIDCGRTSRTAWTRRSIVSCLIGSLLLMLTMAVTPTKSSASVSIFVSFGPPAIPVYVQPACPAPGYIWTPGYWAWDPGYGYFWVPGTWVPAPFVGALWTPGYWGWTNRGYAWYPGYWGTAVGFYGGINYGFGYTGHGYYGGYWSRGSFYYNRDVNRITSRNITTVYTQRVIMNDGGPRVSYNGGRGGIEARPTASQLAAERQRRFGAINQQTEQERFARGNPAQRARINGGRPEVAATPRPGTFGDNGVVRANRAGGPYNEPSREVRNGSEFQHTAPSQTQNRARVESPPSGNAPRQAAPNARVETRVPSRQGNGQPAYRNSQPGTIQHNQRQTGPAEVRRSEGRSAQERPAHTQNQGMHKGGNGHGPGGGRR